MASFGSSSKRAVVVGNRAIEIALGLFGNTAPAVSGGEFRVEFQRAAVVGNRAVEIALAYLGNSAAVVLVAVSAIP